MLEEIVSCLETNKHLLNGDTVTLENHKAHLKALISEIKKEEEHHFMSKTVRQITNCRLKFEISKDISSMDRMLEAFAQDINDEDLLEDANSNHLDYMMLESDAFENKACSRIALLQKYASQLKTYGLQVEQLAVLREKITLHNNEEQSLKNELSSQFYSTKEKETYVLIKKIDPIVAKFKTTHTAFHNSYFCIREKYV